MRTAEDEDKDVCHDAKNEKEEDLGEQEYITDIAENMSDKKFKVPSYKYCRQNQISIGTILIPITRILIISYNSTHYLYICMFIIVSKNFIPGKSMVKEVQGFYCERCRRFMLLDEDMNAHLRSITHYRNFVAEVKSLTLNTTATETKETEQSEVSKIEEKAGRRI